MTHTITTKCKQMLNEICESRRDRRGKKKVNVELHHPLKTAQTHDQLFVSLSQQQVVSHTLQCNDTQKFPNNMTRSDSACVYKDALHETDL